MTCRATDTTCIITYVSFVFYGNLRESMLLTEKVVLVTGGAQGLGLAFTEIFLDQGAEVITYCFIDIDCL
jgi:NADPH:quinone reductase-like Zn-dependent oxidoreductase